MKYSFITPIYNTDIQLLKKSRLSIKKLQLEDYEIIWVNDGSTHSNLVDYCREQATIDKNIVYVEQKNQGSAVARNKGLDLATGDYIIFVDADDTIAENFMFDYYSDNYDIVCYSYNWVSDDFAKKVNIESKLGSDIDVKKNIIKNILYNPNILRPYDFGTIWSKRFSKKFLDKHQIRFRDELRKTQDRIFMLEAIDSAQKIVYSPQVMYNYFQNSNSITHRMDFRIIDYYITLIDVFQSIMVKNKMDKSLGNYFNYSVFIETLPLTYFHPNCTLSTKEKKKGVQDLYSNYQLDAALQQLTLSDFHSLKQKIKFLIIKYRLFYLLKAIN